MGWETRDYHPQKPQDLTQHPLWRWVLGSVPLGTYARIRVRVHAALIWWMAIQLLMTMSVNGMRLADALASVVVLFVSVLLHEFGHCWGARTMGGAADDILMWPLGGLASVHHPHKPLAALVTVISGPAVSAALAILAGIALFALGGGYFSLPLNPITLFSGGIRMDLASYNLVSTSWTAWGLWWIFLVNWSLLFFNLLPIFPMDGGRLVQALLWKPLGYHRATLSACVLGMIGAGCLGLIGLIMGMFFLVFIAVFTFMSAYQIKRQTEHEGVGGISYSPTYNPRPVSRGNWLIKKQKEAQERAKEQAQVDAILRKVSEKGLHSLTWWEKRTLRQATQRQQREEQE
jgi:stage IV sporulation protein FB